MLISKNWLKDYVFLPDSLDPAELALRLKLTTVEIEGITKQGEYLDHVVVGLVKKCEKHPQADRLQVCQVNIGNEDVEIVCGGSNVREGMKVALAKIGAKVLWHGGGREEVLAETKIRGVASFGMICGADEIGLGDLFPKKDEKEILDISDVKDKPGTSLAKALKYDDVIFDIDNKSMTHRPDLWGHLGVAREIAAIERKEYTQPKSPAIKPGKQKTLFVKVKEPTLCSRYMGVMMDGIEIKPSSEHIQRRLQAVGIRPINNIVDITNYVMFDVGQPLHAFDAAQVEKNEIVVRLARTKETMTALDKKEYTLSEQMLVIANNEKTLAIAGVIGGEASGVSVHTKKIIIESANFQASSIRKTAQALGVRTESSSRFEKTLDPALCELALRRAVELIRESCPQAKLVSNIVDLYPKIFQPKPIVVSLETIVRKIGIIIEKKNILDILNRLGFSVKEKKNTLFITVPSWRATKDVTAPEDIIEEIARIYGYDRIPGTLPSFSIVPPPTDPLRILARSARIVLSNTKKFSEVYNYSFVSREWLKQLGMHRQDYLELDNQIAKDRPCLRRTLTPGLLEQVADNARRSDLVALFELGRVYLAEEPGERAKPNGDELLPRQPHVLGMVFSQKGKTTPFFVVSDAVRALLTAQQITFSFETKKEVPAYAHSGRCAQVVAHGTVIGHIYEVHPAIQERIGVRDRIAVAELDLEKIISLPLNEFHYKSAPSFPFMSRDIAFVVDDTVQHSDIEHMLLRIHSLIVSVELFDVYQGKHVESGKKSMAYRITYGSPEKTLLSEDVDAIHTTVINKLVSALHATVRA